MSQILAVGAHPDDVELGAGASLARHIAAGDDVTILVFTPGRAGEDTPSHALAAAQVLGANLKMLSYRDQELDTYPLTDLVREVELLIYELQPTTVYTHHGGDLNLDHELVARAVATACRPLPGSSVEELLAFEVPSSTEWGSDEPFTPNVYHVLNVVSLESKLEALECYRGEMRERPHPRSETGVRLLAALRGMHVGVDYAEAFELVRLIA